MAFPLHTDASLGPNDIAAPAGPDDAVDIGNLVDPDDGDLKFAIHADVDVDSAAVRDRRGDDLDDEVSNDEFLNDAASGEQLQLADLGVLPELAAMHQLPEHEAAYARAARAANTLRGYRSDWADFTTWCTTHDTCPMPATPAALTGYLVALAEAGAKVGTLSRRLSSIKFAHASAGHPDPATHPRVMAVWEGVGLPVARTTEERTPQAVPGQARRWCLKSATTADDHQGDRCPPA